MSKWICIDDLEYDTDWDSYADGFTAYSQLAIDTAPSLDLVTCAECKHMEIKTHPKSSEMVCPIMFETDGTSHDLWAIVQPDDFCSYGERKEIE